MRLGARVAAAGALAALLGAAARPSAAQLFTAEDAVRRALTNPVVRQAEEQLAAQRASLREAEGLFDDRLNADSRVDYGLEELIAARLKSEQDRRLRLEIPPPILDDTAARLIDRLPIDSSILLPGSCQTATAFVFLGETETLLCLDEDGNLLAIIDPNLGLDPASFGTVALGEAFAGVDGIDERVQVFVDLLRATAADQMRLVALILRRTANSLRFQRVRIGDLPLDREAILFNAGVDWRHPFENGTAVISTIGFDSSEENFRDKPLSPTLGDSGVANQFRVTAGVALDLPLGRGAGRVSARAPIVAAGHGVEAARSLLEHTASERALAALEAYWDAAVAAERVTLFEESRTIQQRLLGATEQLVEADVVARVDLALNRARLATVEASSAGARQALDVARANLVRAVGMAAEDLAAGPQTVVGLDPWLPQTGGETPSGADVDALIRAAAERREDLAAAASVVEANRALAAAARHDLLPDFRLSLNLSYNAFHESFGERFYDVEGFEKAVEGVFAGPSYGLALTFRLPVGNNAARGRLLQAESDTAVSQIDATDLGRTVRLRLIELVGALERARRELEARRETLARIEETQSATEERFKAGDLTVLDTLTTEEQLTGARLEVLDAERRYLSLLARLRFETGSLLEIPEDASVAGAQLVPFDRPVI